MPDRATIYAKESPLKRHIGTLAIYINLVHRLNDEAKDQVIIVLDIVQISAQSKIPARDDVFFIERSLC